MDTRTENLNKAIVLMGGLTEATRKLKVKRYQTIQSWRVAGVPEKYCPMIERETGGEVRCEMIRPDVEWEVLRKAA